MLVWSQVNGGKWAVITEITEMESTKCVRGSNANRFVVFV
jgi:hypothetical protein